LLPLSRWACSIALALTACGADPQPPAPVCQAYVSPAGTDLTSPVVSLHADVMPVFAFSCAFSSCHATTDSQNNGIYLGNKAQPSKADASAVRTRLLARPVGVELPYVTPGMPELSYLMHKLVGDLCNLEARCTKTCGAPMPFGQALLDPATRDILRRWIAQGAQDN
jgi:hypothetical protein